MSILTVVATSTIASKEADALLTLLVRSNLLYRPSDSPLPFAGFSPQGVFVLVGKGILGGAGPSDLMGELGPRCRSSLRSFRRCSCLSLWFSLRLRVNSMHLRGVRQITHNGSRLIQIDLHGVKNVAACSGLTPTIGILLRSVWWNQFPRELFRLNAARILSKAVIGVVTPGSVLPICLKRLAAFFHN